MKTELDIALFQSTLMEKLFTCEDARKLTDECKNDPRLADFHDYLQTFDLNMVELGAELVKKWGRKEPSDQATDN